MQINSILPYFGGKRTMAPTIVNELGPHHSFFDPMCGSLATLFAKPPSRNENVNDLHGDLVNLALVLQSEQLSDKLYRRAQRTLCSEGLLAVARETLTNGEEPEVDDNSDFGLAVERAYWFFVASWLGRNGTAGTTRPSYNLAVRWTPGGGAPATRFQSAVESIPEWHQRLQKVTITSRDCFAFLDKIADDEGTAIYCDPPYHPSSRVNGSYLHDFEEHHHDILAEALSRFKKARVVVSYYDCDAVRELYLRGPWRFVTHSRQKHLHAASGRGERKKTAPEVLIVNGPSYRTESNHEGDLQSGNAREAQAAEPVVNGAARLSD